MTQLINVFLYTIHFIISLFLILVVLLQQGKGADLSVFGGGASQAAFGARGAATVLHKATVICFVLFIVTTLTIGIVQARSNSSIVGGIEAVEVEEPASDLTAPAGGVLPTDDTATSGDADAEEGEAAAPEATESGEATGEGDETNTASDPPSENAN